MLGSTAAVLVVFVGVNIAVDNFGVFRSTRNRSIKNYWVERTAKYLFALQYIPENFDSLLIGSSISDNIPVAKITVGKMYNSSINGGNISEAAIVAREALARRRFSHVVFCINPYLVKNHGRKTSYSDPREYWEAIGSSQLLLTYLSRGLVFLGRRADYYTADGCYLLNLDPLPKSASELIDDHVTEIRAGRAASAFTVDPVAWRELDGLIQLAVDNGAKVVAYLPPIPEAIRSVQDEEERQFAEKVRQLLFGRGALIDFNSPAYKAFRADVQNYRDSAHLSEMGAVALAEELDRKILAAGR